ncbi:MAG: ABC transporter permease subunit [Gammaproteobacteria bacterium]|nr:MAG: ABC transporter permease subunit [Gammaproteobacteria bacterium]
MIFTIAARELRSLFLSPLAWAILAVVQFIIAYLFLSQIDGYLLLQPRLAAIEGAPGVSDVVVAPLLADAGIVLLLITPLITMRLLSEERRNRTLSLLFSAPVSMTEIILGKYLGVLAFFGVMIGLLALMPLSLLAGTALDLGKLAAGLTGLVLLVAAFAAIGLFMSSLTEQPTVAAISTFGLLLLLWIIDWAGASADQTSGLFAYLSLLRHYESLLKGLFNSADVLYYLLISILFLGLSIRRLDADRLQH